MIDQDFQARAQLAKLDLDDLVKPCQRLKFSNVCANDLTLMEVNDELLEFIESGNR